MKTVWQFKDILKKAKEDFSMIDEMFDDELDDEIKNIRQEFFTLCYETYPKILDITDKPEIFNQTPKLKNLSEYLDKLCAEAFKRECKWAEGRFK